MTITSEWYWWARIFTIKHELLSTDDMFSGWQSVEGWDKAILISPESSPRSILQNEYFQAGILSLVKYDNWFWMIDK